LLSQLPTLETTVSPDMTPTNALTTYYLGGLALAMLKRWTESVDWLEVCTTFPAMGNAVSAVQVEALKRLILVQLIAFGKVSNESLVCMVTTSAWRTDPSSQFMTDTANAQVHQWRTFAYGQELLLHDFC
jgi:hypothetical protein